ncbi:hypothetical protein GCM10023334_052670 [Nonomuraea thailandensis]
MFDRLGPLSLIVAILAVLAGTPLGERWGAPPSSWTMPALGIVALALAWPGLRSKPTISTVSNRSMSVAGLMLGTIALGLGAVHLVLDFL